MGRKCVLGIVGVLSLVCLFCPASAMSTTPKTDMTIDPKVTLDFETGLITPSGTLVLSNGETFAIQITGLTNGLFDIQVSETKFDKKSGTDSAGREDSSKQIITIVHRSEFSSYQIIVKRSNPGSEANAIDSRTWAIPVFTHNSDVTIEPKLTLDFETGLITPFGTLKLSNGETFAVEIIGLAGGYRLYDTQVSGTKNEPEPETKNSLKLHKKITLEEITQETITVVHRSEFSSYQIVVKRHDPGKNPNATNSRTWVIPVFTHGWALDFCGGFVVDTLTNPVYYTEQGTGTDTANYYIHENKNAEDKFTLGLVAMVHLYHTKALGNPDWICWAPLTFGLGFGANTEARYYFGTSCRFGGQVYLTAGGSFGSISALPANCTLDAKADQSALTTLSKRNSWGFFLSLSYAFSGTAAKEKLQQPFSTSTKGT